MNIVNVIFGGEGGFPSKCAYKLTLREILSVEPTTIKPLRYSNVLISSSRDDQWTSFSEPGKFPLVLDPVMACLQLTRVLIDGGSSLNLLFVSTLKKMGLDISKMLTPSRALWTGILKMPGKTGVLTLRGDLKKSYDYNQEAIEYAPTSHIQEPSAEVLTCHTRF
jgi:hypothetical protein